MVGVITSLFIPVKLPHYMLQLMAVSYFVLPRWISPPRTKVDRILRELLVHTPRPGSTRQELPPTNQYIAFIPYSCHEPLLLRIPVLLGTPSKFP